MPKRSNRRWPGVVRRVGGLLPRWRVTGLLSAMIVVVVLPYLVTRASTEDALQADTWVTRSAEIKSLAYQLAFEIRDSESAMYHLLDNGDDPQARARAEFAATDTPVLLGRLREMSGGSPAQQPALDALGTMVNGRLALMKQALLRYAQGDRAGAAATLRDAGTLFKVDEQIQSIVDNEDDVLRLRRANARQRSFRSNVVLAITVMAQVLMLGVIVLVSEWQIGRRVTAEARESRAIQRASMILQAVREPIALLDDQLHTLLVNTAFGELYGVPRRERRAQQPLAEVGGGAWSDDGLLQRLHDVLLHDRELWDYELMQHTLDGVERHVLVNARRLAPHDSEAPVLLLTVSDITARALVERQVKELNRQLEGKVAQISDVNRELEAFSYSVSHDLRAPLRHIAGFAGKLERHLGEGVDETGRHYLDVIRDSARRMAELIDELLVFSRLGRGALRLQPVDMQTLADEARALAESEAGGRRIVWDVSPLPVVVGDENMLRTVWQNLLGNAVKYTAQRETAHIAVAARRSADGGYEFSVADDGVGFDMLYADKLFGVFQRLHKASEFPGNGIGLANVRRIVARHGGRVWAEAEPDRGAIFHFYLPPAEQASPAPARMET